LSLSQFSSLVSQLSLCNSSLCFLRGLLMWRRVAPFIADISPRLHLLIPLSARGREHHRCTRGHERDSRFCAAGTHSRLARRYNTFMPTPLSWRGARSLSDAHRVRAGVSSLLAASIMFAERRVRGKKEEENMKEEPTGAAYRCCWDNCPSSNSIIQRAGPAATLIPSSTASAASMPVKPPRMTGITFYINRCACSNDIPANNDRQHWRLYWLCGVQSRLAHRRAWAPSCLFC